MHALLLVIGSTEEALEANLDPFNFSTKDKRWLVFEDKDAQFHEDFETCLARRVKLLDGTLVDPSEDSFKFDDEGHYKDWPEGAVEVHIPAKEAYPDFEAFLRDWKPDADQHPETKKYGEWKNPNGKMAYYGIGGRFKGFFDLTANGRGSFGPVLSRMMDGARAPGTADITQMQFWDQQKQMAATEDKYRSFHRQFHKALEDRPAPPVHLLRGSKEDREAYEKHPTVIHLKSLPKEIREYFWGDYESLLSLSEEQFVEVGRMRSVLTFAVLKDGVWYERSHDGRAGTQEEIKDLYVWYDKVQTLLADMKPDCPLIAVEYRF